MARYLFITWDGGGNQTPTLALAQALREHGHDIVFVGYESQRARITARGFPFSVLERSNAAFHPPLSDNKLAAMVAGVWVSPAHLEDVPDAAARHEPDLLVLDCLLPSALAAAELHHLPAVVLVHSAPGLQVPPAGPFERFVLLEPVNALRSGAGLPPVASIWENWARFPTLCASLPILDPLAASAPAAFTYVGPLREQLPPSGWQLPWSGDDSRPLVLVSFSTTRMWDQASRIQRTLTGLAGKPVRVLVTSNETDTTQLIIPENARVVPSIPHIEVLPHTAVLVTHGGHGTITAALEYGVPVVCLPNTTSDQPGLAAQVAALGAGIALDGDNAPAEAIGDVVTRILSDPSFADAAHRLQAAIDAAHAPETAVAWLEERVATAKNSV